LAIADLAQLSWSGAAGEHLGTSVGLGDVRGDTLAEPLMGAERAGGDRGAVRGVILTEGLWADTDFVSVVGSNPGDRVGGVSARAGDQDGDGIVDLVAAGSDPTGARSTVVLTMVPGGSFLAGEKTMGSGVINLMGAGGTSGGRVYSALDLDGDGLDDILYGDPTSSSPTFQSGKVSLIYTADIQGPSLHAASFVSEFTGTYGKEFVGMGLGGGDMNGDGYDDAFVGAPGEEPDATYVDSGSWTIYAGGAAPADGTLGTGALARITVAADRTGMGWGTPTLADVDGDGTEDLAFGGFGSNRVWVYLNPSFSGGSTYDADSSASMILTGTGHFGFAVSGGDFDNDGVDDLVVGAPSVDSPSPEVDWELLPGTAAGVAYVFRGPLAAGDQATASAMLSGSPGDLFGAVISAADKVTSDDFADVLIGAPNAGSGGEGTVYLYSGSPTN
ncbi:MAG TPA: VCBS repeat-containing protein, partial [Myxococcota bacterium]|nr:VCBS repeat-containing protein [Myxococcota bacterium]